MIHTDTNPAKLLPQISVRNVQENESRSVENTLEQATITDPVMQVIFGGVPASGRLTMLYKTMSQNPYVRTRVATIDGAICGALREANHPQCRDGILESMRNFCNTVTALRGKILTGLRSPLISDSRHHPQITHRHLLLIGVHPIAQRQGVGTALVRDFVARADADNLEAFLETHNSVAKSLYASVGFKSVTFQQWRGFTFWYMWRASKIDRDSNTNSGAKPINSTE